MKKIVKIAAGLTAVLSLMAMPAQALTTDMQIYDHYIYSNEGVPLRSPAAALPEKMIGNDIFGLEQLPSIVDIFVSHDQTIYAVDNKNNCIIVLNNEFQLVKIIDKVNYTPVDETTEPEIPDEGEEVGEPVALAEGEETGEPTTPDEGEETGEPITPAEGEENGESTAQGKEAFGRPEGIFVTKDDIIYLADTDNRRIVIMDTDGNLIREHVDPEIDLLKENVAFQPSKVTVDNGGRMYIVAKNINRGLVQLDSEGDFIGFLGAPRVVPNPIELFWKSISTEAQKEGMDTYVPTEYNNMAIDGSGFIYATIGTLDPTEFNTAILTKDKSGTVTPIRKLNNTGIDVLPRAGEYAPVGDIFINWENPSIIVDVALSSDGRYSMLDSRRGRVFTYDADGNLLYIFGGRGSQFGQVQDASSLEYLGDRILIADKSLGRITSYKITEYGQCINDAVKLNAAGKYEDSAKKWQEALQMNSNLYVAYIGLGKSELRKENYTQAMEYLQTANEKKYYSKAFENQRKEILDGIFNLLGVLVVASIVAFFVIRRIRKRKKQKGEK